MMAIVCSDLSENIGAGFGVCLTFLDAVLLITSFVSFLLLHYWLMAGMVALGIGTMLYLFVLISLSPLLAKLCGCCYAVGFGLFIFAFINLFTS